LLSSCPAIRRGIEEGRDPSEFVVILVVKPKYATAGRYSETVCPSRNGSIGASTPSAKRRPGIAPPGMPALSALESRLLLRPSPSKTYPLEASEGDRLS